MSKLTQTQTYFQNKLQEKDRTVHTDPKGNPFGLPKSFAMILTHKFKNCITLSQSLFCFSFLFLQGQFQVKDPLKRQCLKETTLKGCD